MEKINHDISPKPSIIQRVIPIILVIAVVFILMSVMRGMKTEPAKVPEKPIGFLVETATVEPTDLTLSIESQGPLQPRRQIALVSEISGKVSSLSPVFTVGGLFKAGEVLVTLDPADYQVAVARAEAGLASAQAQMDLEQARSEQAQKDWQSFGKKGQPSDLLLNKPQLAGAEASVKAAAADLEKAKRDLAKTKIKAPFNGTVLSKTIDLGQYISMNGQLGSLAGTEVGEVRLPLSNEDIGKLNISSSSLQENPLPVTFMSEQNEKQVSGLVKRIESSKDSRTLMNYVVAEIEQPFEADLLFNAFLQAKITGSSFTGLYAVPSAWMMPNDQLAVFINSDEVNKGQLEIKSVKVAHTTKDYFYVEQGLTTNDQIITTPIQAPEEGMKLRKLDLIDTQTELALKPELTP